MKSPPLPLEEAQARLLALAEPLLPVEASVEDALGRFLAGRLRDNRTQPSCDLSAMDGYAVRFDDLAGPWHVIGESAAGHPYDGVVAHGQAIRISTGAAMPAGAGCVILQEDIAREADTITLTGEPPVPPVPPGKHIRRTGMDFRTGDELLPAGTRIGPAQIALAIGAGHTHLPVRRALSVAVPDSGDERARSGEPGLPQQVPASNGAMLCAMVAALPCAVRRIGPVADDLAALSAALAHVEDADVIVTSGGVSVGDHDLIRPALEAWGANLDFWRVAIKPGKPLLVARRGRQIVLGLPGNPVSSYVTAYLFLLPLLRAMLGARDPLPRTIMARLSAPLGPGGSRREFLRARWDGDAIAPLALQDSGALSSLAASNALIDRAALAEARQPGAVVRAYLLENGGIA